MNVNPASEDSNLRSTFNFITASSESAENLHVSCVGKTCQWREHGGVDVKCSKKELRAVRGGDGQDVGGSI